MLNSIVAVAGTLFGALLAIATQRMARREARDDVRYQDAVKAVAEFLAALAEHRHTMFLREELRLRGERGAVQNGAGAYEEARERTRETRRKITAPRASVILLVPALADLAREVTEATYVLRGVPNLDALKNARQVARDAEESFIEAAERVFHRHRKPAKALKTLEG